MSPIPARHGNNLRLADAGFRNALFRRRIEPVGLSMARRCRYSITRQPPRESALHKHTRRKYVEVDRVGATRRFRHTNRKIEIYPNRR